MAKRSSPSSPGPRTAKLTIEQVRAAIPKLERRLRDLDGVDVEALTDDDEDIVLGDLQRRIDDTLMSIYGVNSTDYHRYFVGGFDDTPITMVGSGYPSIAQRRPALRSGILKAKSKLESALSILKEQLDDAGGTAGSRAVTAYQALDLHPEIARAASKLYRDGHYGTAVEHAVKALNDLVRLRSRLTEDGTTLMERAFSPKNPVLKFNGLSSQSDTEEQKGFMMMFSGAVSGLRNPRAHRFFHDDPERALEFIAFVSLLAKLLDEAVPC
jgi:uncharacterized protein (TIGR02391 family)